MTTPTLPPLPEPATSVAYIGRPVLGYYSPDQMRDYALAAIEAYKASLRPVAWIGGPHGAIRADPEYRLTGPQTLDWKLPLYLLDDQP
jgi:hypothetical protein